MLEDLRLMILIVVIVGFGFLIIDGFRRRLKKNSITQKFEQTVFENNHQSNNHHPNHHHDQTHEDMPADRINKRESSASTQDASDPLFGDIEPLAISAMPKKNTAILGAAQAMDSIAKPAKAPVQKNVNAEPLVITLSIASRSGGFSGRTLEAVLKGNYFYFSSKNIFHRHVGDSPSNPVLYSVAQSVEPGIFDLEKMKHQRIAGLVIFMVLPTIDTAHNMHIFEQMLKSARQLAAHLNGELCDDQHNYLTTQTLEAYRQKIQHYDERLLALKAE
ncbi:hypothetical protein CC99x_008445 [Candidatus Berkiella cookevillensis]|uniref:Cell division protein ZipA n=1 Tax=Candidatus Berkiella cookevillensis TaxID=437022 RepID=A0A0Q9YNZ2_9GAMM|nr:cell division protein ZipA C-terminal FtsZ-binding domain-containing protein [Candidatus Berkiella cookevillensis]MCS5708928.1 hypothetical protein [Candidatus Berkiella cookevillensis]